MYRFTVYCTKPHSRIAFNATKTSNNYKVSCVLELSLRQVYLAYFFQLYMNRRILANILPFR